MHAQRYYITLPYTPSLLHHSTDPGLRVAFAVRDVGKVTGMRLHPYHLHISLCCNTMTLHNTPHQSDI
jgi:hypothetical protein